MEAYFSNPIHIHTQRFHAECWREKNYFAITYPNKKIHWELRDISNHAPSPPPTTPPQTLNGWPLKWDLLISQSNWISVPLRKIPFRKVPFRKIPLRKIPFLYPCRSWILYLAGIKSHWTYFSTYLSAELSIEKRLLQLNISAWCVLLCCIKWGVTNHFSRFPSDKRSKKTLPKHCFFASLWKLERNDRNCMPKLLQF